MKQRDYKTTQPIRSRQDLNAMSSYLYKHNIRDWALFTFGIYTGRRISDIVNLKVKDVAFIDRRGRLRIKDCLQIQERKTGKFILFAINETARYSLQVYLKSRIRETESLGALLNEPLFKSRQQHCNGLYHLSESQCWRILNRAARALELPYKVASHSMRKTFGYMLYKYYDISVAVIQKLLNHASPETTLDYIGIGQDDMNDAVLSMRPLRQIAEIRKYKKWQDSEWL